MAQVLAFLFDEDNIEKFAAHGLAWWQVEDILDDTQRVVVPNRRRRRAAFLVIGRDRSGRCIAAPIESTWDPTLWRPVTAWPCKRNESARLPSRG